MTYYIEDHGETIADAVDIGDGNGMHGHDSFTAEEAAEYEHNSRDGWEAGWPMTITLVDDRGIESRWEVDRESVPSFNATPAS